MLENRVQEEYVYCNLPDLLMLNKKYQDSVIALKNSKNNKIKKYLDLLKRGNMKALYKELKYRQYARKNFSTAANRSFNSKKEKKVCKEIKIAVYCCITGKYDNVIEPLIREKNIDYIMFTDQIVPKDSIWEKVDITELPEYEQLSSVELNRRIKMIPYDYLKEYDYTVYVDGNIQVVYGIRKIIEDMNGAPLGIHYHPTRDCIYDEGVSVVHYNKANPADVWQQLKQYEKEGFPAHYGMTENSIIVRKCNDLCTEKLMREWWNEYVKFPTRDQFTLPYLMWKLKYSKENFVPLGNNLECNPSFNRVQKHLVQK